MPRSPTRPSGTRHLYLVVSFWESVLDLLPHWMPHIQSPRAVVFAASWGDSAGTRSGHSIPKTQHNLQSGWNTPAERAHAQTAANRWGRGPPRRVPAPKCVGGRMILQPVGQPSSNAAGRTVSVATNAGRFAVRSRPKSLCTSQGRRPSPPPNGGGTHLQYGARADLDDGSRTYIHALPQSLRAGAPHHRVACRPGQASRAPVGPRLCPKAFVYGPMGARVASGRQPIKIFTSTTQILRTRI